MMKSWTFFRIIFILTFMGACSRNPLGEDLTQTIVNMGFRLSHTCVTSLNQDVTFNCSIQTDDATLTDLVWTLEPNTTCAWAGINAATGEVTGTPNDDNVGTCVIEVGSRNTMRRALNMPITMTVQNIAPVFTPIANATNILEDAALSVIRVDADVANSEEGFGFYGFSHATATAPSCSASATTLTIDPTTGAISFQPAANYFGTCNINVSFDDGNGQANSVTTSEFSITVDPVNDAPVLAAIPDQSTFEGSALPINLNVSDVDDVILCSALNLSATSSNLALVNAGSISWSGTVPNCILTVNPIAFQNGVTTITVTATDGTLSSTDSFDLTVVPVPDPPVLAPIANQNGIEDTDITFAINITDPDTALTCSGANLSATSSNVTLLPVANIVFSGIPPNCTVTMTPALNQNGISNVTIQLTDGTTSVTQNLTATYAPVNDSPLISAIANETIAEDSFVIINYTISDVDNTLDCSTSMSATSSNAALIPVASIVFSGTAPNCSATLTPLPDQNGISNLNFTVSDGTLTVSSAMVLTVNAVNDAPIISAITDEVINEDSFASVNFTITDVDDVLTCAGSVSAVSSNLGLLPNGNIVFSGTAPNCSATLTPTLNQSGISNIDFTVSDTVLTDVSSFTLTVNGVNDAPTISPIANEITNEDTATGAVTFTITDADSVLLCTSANLSVVSSNTGILPTANIVFGGTAPNCTVTMTPLPDQFGVSNIDITVMDNGVPNLQAVSSFSLTVNPINDAPIISVIPAQTTSEGVALVVNFTVSDVDDALTCTGSISAASSDAVLLPVGNISFGGVAPNCTATLTPAANQNGVTNLDFTVSDTILTATSSFALTVTAVDDPPTISVIADQTVAEDGSVVVNFTITDIDSAITCTSSVSATSSDSVLLNAGSQIIFAGVAPNCTATLNPATNQNGITNIVFTVSDGVTSVNEPFSLTVTPVNDAPVISALSNTTIAEDTSTAALALTITDVDNTLDCAVSLSATSSDTTLLPIGNIVFAGTAPNCTVVMTPDSNQTGSSNVVVTVTDGTATMTSPMTLTVTPVNDAPVISVIANQTTLEDTATGAVAFTISDVDNVLTCGGSVSASSTDLTVLPVGNIVIGGVAPNCTVTMTPAANQSGVSNVVLTVDDGLLNATSGFSFTVTAQNDAPVIAAIVNQTTPEDTATGAIAFTISDVDNVLTCGASVSATSSDGVLLPVGSIAFAGAAPNCTVTMTPAANQFGLSNIVLTVTDGSLSATSSYSLTVTAVNDAPVISAIGPQSATEGGSVIVNFTISDVDNAPTCAASVSATSSNTTLMPVPSVVFGGVAPNCTATLSPAANENGTSNMIFTVTDGSLTATSNFVLTVSAYDDPPTISAIPDDSVNEDTSLMINFTINDIDSVLNCSTSMSATSSNVGLIPVANIVFAGTAPNCTATLNPVLDQSGVSNIVFTVADGSSNVTEGFAYTVLATNDAPIISAIGNDTISEDSATGAIAFTISDVDNILNCATSLSATSSDATLLPVANIVFAGVAPNCTVTMTPVADQFGASNVVLTVTDGTLVDTSPMTLTVTAVNDTPIISAIGNQTTAEDTATGAIPFTITDVDNILLCTAANLSVTSSNIAVLPTANIVIGGAAPNCTVTLTPEPDQSGVSNIVITVMDNGTPNLQATSNFSYTVTAQNDAPVISAIGNQITAEDTDTGAIAFTISDADDTLTCATSVSATSSDTTVLSVGNIVIAGVAPNCTVTMTPDPDQFGVSNVVLTVTDGTLSATSNYSLTVTAVNDAPIISAIANQSTFEATDEIINFTINDVDNALTCAASVSATSSDTTLLPVGNIVFTGTAPNCIATLSPAPNQNGVSNIVFTLTDGTLVDTAAFSLTVTPVDDPPTISVIADQVTPEDTPIVINYTINDPDTALDCTTSMSATSSDTTLLPVGNIVFGGVTPNCTATVSPALNQNGLSNVVLTVTDGFTPVTEAFSVTVTAVNDAPVISAIVNQTTAEDTATAAIAFTITDVDSVLNCGTSMSATSSDTTLLPVANIAFAGTAPNCTVTMTPAADQNGVSNIVLTVTDGVLPATSSYSLTVTAQNDAPVISAIINQTTNEDTVTGAIAFTINDLDSVLDCTTSVSATSSDGVLLPVGNITFAGAAPNCTVTMNPALNQFGVSNIVLTVTDGSLSDTSSYSLTVTAENDAPVISAIVNQTTNEETATGAIAFTITDVDNVLTCGASMSATSSDTVLLPVGSIVFGGVAPNCTVTMTPAADQSGLSNVVLTVTDGLLSATSSFSLTVTAQNDAPVISAIVNQTTNEDTATGAIAFTISDVDSVLTCGASVSATSSDGVLLPVGSIAFGGVAPNCTVTMTPAADQFGVSNIVLTVTDGSLSATSAYSLTVTAVNDAPVISAIVNQSTNEDIPTGAIAFTITDIDSALLCTSANLSATSSDTAVLPVANIVFGGTAPNCTVTMTPDLNQNGVSNVVITVVDNGTPNLQDTSAFSLTVTAVNDAPVISTIINQTTAEDTATAAIAFTITDVDSALTCAASISATSSDAVLLPVGNIAFGGVAPNCTVTMTPAPDQNGLSNIVLTVTDGTLTDTSNFSLTVTAVNDAPVISAIVNQTTPEDTATAAIAFTMTDVDNVLTCGSSVSATSSDGVLLPVGNIAFGGVAPNCTVTLNPATDQNGLSNIVLTVSDGTETDTSSFSLTVTAVNDAPVIAAIVNQTTPEDTATAAIAFTITDVDNVLTCGSSVSATSSDTALLPLGNIVIAGVAPNCTVTMSPALNLNGVSNIVLTVTDGTETDTSSFSLTVTPVNDAPVISVIADQSTPEESATGAIAFTISDVDDVVTCAGSVSASSSNLTLLPMIGIVIGGTEPNCTVTMTPAADQTGISNVVLTVTDGLLSSTSPFDLTVTSINDAPLISAIADQTTSEDVATGAIAFTISDVDNVLACGTSVSATSSNGALLPVGSIAFGGTAPNCTVTMTPALNQFGVTNIVLTVTDGLLSATSGYSLTVTPVNDAPTISTVVNQTTQEDVPVDLAVTISDVDSILICDPANISISSSNTTLLPLTGFTITGTVPNCNIHIVPSLDETGVSNIVITVNDNETPNLQASTAFTFTVTPGNDSPVLSNFTDATIAEDGTLIKNFTITDVDSVLDCVTSMVATSSNQTLLPDANVIFSGTAPNCTATITPAANRFGLTDIMMSLSDGAGGLNNRLFTMTVTSVNDNPVISAIADQSINEDTSTGSIAFTISDVETAVSCTTSMTMTSTNTALVPVANVVFSGTAPNCTAVITPTSNVDGTSNLAFVVTDIGGLTGTAAFVITVVAVNDTPTISIINNQTINEDSATSALAFTIADSESVLSCATSLSATSSDVGLLPVANIVFAGTAPNCTVTMTPVANGNGASNVEVTVTDGSLTASRIMALTVTAVNDPPTISAIGNQTTNEDTATAAIATTIADVETALTCAGSLSATSSNITVLPVANIVFGGAAPNCTVTMTPAANEFGVSNVVVTVSDGVDTATTSFSLTVNSVNDVPVISAIGNQTLKTDGSVVLNYTLTDLDHTMNCSTSVTATSGTTTVIANADITKGGTAPNCTLTITPSLNLAGTSTITVTATDGIASPNTTFVVTAVSVSSLAVSPTPFSMVNTGSTQQITATATYSDSSTADVTTNANANWSSNATGVATVNNAASKGLVTAAAGNGNVNITATHKGQSAIAAGTIYQMTGITVSQSVVTGGINSNQAVTAQAILNPSGTSDITAVTAWSTSNGSVATVSGGVISLLSAGTATITATYAGYSQTISVTVQNKTLTSIAVTPASPSVAVSGTQDFVATATYSDASTQVVTTSAVWSSSNDGIATVSNTAPTIGRATGVASGSVTITATIGAISGSATLTVTGATLVSIAITPYDSLVTSNGTFQLVATGTFSDASTSNITEQVTWSSSNTLAATISNTAGTRGRATTPTFTGYRTTTITATQGAINGTTPFGVNGATVSSILVTPTVTVMPGSTYNLQAWANLSDGGTIEVTEFAVWTSGTTAAATVSNGSGTKGLVTGVANGTSVISAVYSGVTGTRTVTVAGSESVTEVGTGLTGMYYVWSGGSPPASPFLAGNKRGERIDARIAFAWATGNAPMGVGNLFSVRWTGQYKAVGATNYFCTYSDDGVRVWINGALVINNWTDHAPVWNCSGNIALTAGTKYSVVMEYFENGGGSEAHLTRSGTSAADAQNIGTRIIPQADLYPQ
ncbi:MAG: hypothetical protein A2622_13290 [Bdellovibrionales bacterium RIFCSPHIGHO2_01_FULL_40_29]|nr:MAG: hypothetical protein A2622_13290 [Bdellovibrionales bacterium RIFCSPHIGHO2_01_FULL_40_29]OFZ33338.1 MAG: hypothetical protein A3D17_13595 [Bdellovibrionales bacterium RIFCSPHIGHO2_02_FULL_40_15]